MPTRPDHDARSREPLPLALAALVVAGLLGHSLLAVGWQRLHSAFTAWQDRLSDLGPVL